MIGKGAGTTPIGVAPRFAGKRLPLGRSPRQSLAARRAAAGAAVRGADLGATARGRRLRTRTPPPPPLALVLIT